MDKDEITEDKFFSFFDLDIESLKRMQAAKEKQKGR